MKIKIIVIWLILVNSVTLPYDFLDITQYGYEQYQDIIINNNVIKPATNNHKDCETRYGLIQTILNQYKRPFTLLDLGASQGYYSFRTAHDYNCVCIMIEGNNPAYPMIGDQLLDLCKANNSLDNIILLNKMIVPHDIKRLSECEHFDVVLALNIIHWFGNKWKEIADSILNLGTKIIIETPPQEQIVSWQENKKRKNIECYLIENDAQIIGRVKRHTSNTYSNIYLISRNKEYLERKIWFGPLLSKTHRICSSFEEKNLTKKVNWPPDTFITTIWAPGINFITFKMYNGQYPTKEQLKQNITQLKNIKTNDWMPNNIIIQGNKTIMIDTNDPNHEPGGLGGGRKFSKKLLHSIFQMIDLNNPDEIQKHFWNKIVALN